MRSILLKLASRKLLAAIIGLAAGLAVVFGVNEGMITTICGAVVAASSVVTYIVTEGHIDAAALPQDIKAIQDAISLLSESDE